MTIVCGWGCIGIINSLEKVDRPRPTASSIIGLGLSAIAHVFTAEDKFERWKKSLCGTARMLHSGFDENNQPYFKTDSEQIQILKRLAMLCPDCLKLWNEYQSKQHEDLSKMV